MRKYMLPIVVCFCASSVFGQGKAIVNGLKGLAKKQGLVTAASIKAYQDAAKYENATQGARKYALVAATQRLSPALIAEQRKLSSENSFPYRRLDSLAHVSLVLPAMKNPVRNAVGKKMGNKSRLSFKKVSDEKILNRFLAYVQIESQSIDSPDYSTFPLSEGQKKIAAYVADEINAFKTENVEVVLSDDAYVYVKIPSNLPSSRKASVPSVLFTAHLDVTPECEGVGIKPQVIRNYDGGDIQLSHGDVLSPDSPEGRRLSQLRGKTIVTSDGTTLLGGDDKAGCTVLTTVIENLVRNPKLKHGDVYMVFSTNEDIGRAGERFDVAAVFGVMPDIVIDCDGEDPNVFSVANFTAVAMNILFDGNDRHPGNGAELKYGDALTSSSYFIGQLPPEKHPSASRGKEGYIHCYATTHPIDSAGKEQKEDVVVKIRLRYFDRNEGDTLRHYIHQAIENTRTAYPFVKVDATKEILQYENVAYTLWPGTESLIIGAAQKAGLEMHPQAVRGGTTAAMIVAAKGLNGGASIYSGQNNAHSKKEWVCVEDISDIVMLVHHIINDLVTYGKRG